MSGAFALAQAGLNVATQAANDPNKQRLVDRLFGTVIYGANAPSDEVARVLRELLTWNTEVQNDNGIENGRNDIVRTSGSQTLPMMRCAC
jgi:hypothetical protein